MKKAFTLAEVLITLGIIGVVAAMTLPALIQKQQNIAILTALKKSYSELQNVLNLIANEYGEDILDIVAETDETELNKIFMSYFDNAKDCTDNSCLKNRTLNYVTYTGNPIGSEQVPINVYFYKNRFITKDGRLFVFGGRHKLSNGSEVYYGQLLSVDVNGPFNKPNAWGRDIFSFRIMKGQIKPCGGPVSCSNLYNYNCNASEKGDYSGIGCTYYALTKKNFLDKRYYYDSYTGRSSL